MELVGPPTRSSVYTLEADGAGNYYAPGSLVTLHVRVQQPAVQAQRSAGKTQCQCTGRRCPESQVQGAAACDCDYTGNRCTVDTSTAVMEGSKYLGLLLYAVKANDAAETKVGSWELPVDTSTPRFKVMDGESCEGKAIVQASAAAKRYDERFWFRAPPAGTGPIAFRLLIKQGDTLGGAFYWPTVPSVAPLVAAPQNGIVGGDLLLAELPPTTQAVEWVRGAAGLPCTAVCAASGGACNVSERQPHPPTHNTHDTRTYTSCRRPRMPISPPSRSQLKHACSRIPPLSQGASFGAATSSPGLLATIGNSYLCAPPLLASCDAYAPVASGHGDGWCWYKDAQNCPSSAATECDAVPPLEAASLSGLRFCPCTSTAGRRRLGRSNHTPAAWAAEPEETKPKVAVVKARSAPEPSLPPSSIRPSPAHAPVAEGAKPCPFASAIVTEVAAATATATTTTAAAATTVATTATVTGEASAAASAAPRRLAAVSGGPSIASSSSRWLLPDPSPSWLVALLAASGALALMLGSAVRRAVGEGRARGRGAGVRARGVAPPLLATTTQLLATLGTASAHNWVNSPRSRASKASEVQPCLPRSDPAPGVRVNPGQEFLVEWASGHPGSDHFFIVLKASNEAMMARHTETILNDYLDSAPAPYLEGVAYRKMHYGWTAEGGASRSGGDEATHQNFITQGLTAVAATAPEFAPRPGAFSCAAFGSRLGNRWESQEGCEAMQDLTLYNYPAAGHTADKRAAYTNPQYPWIEAVHKYRGVKPTADKAGFPKQFDTARFAVPAVGGPGQYIVQYYWRGYRDCIDVDVLPATTPVAPTSQAMYGGLQADPGTGGGGSTGPAPPTAPVEYAMTKRDHCQYVAGLFTLYERTRGGVQTCHPIPPPDAPNSLDQTREAALEACKERCKQNDACSALNVVPAVPPSTAKFGAAVNNVPWGQGNGCTLASYANEPAGTSVCYGFMPATLDPGQLPTLLELDFWPRPARRAHGNSTALITGIASSSHPPPPPSLAATLSSRQLTSSSAPSLSLLPQACRPKRSESPRMIPRTRSSTRLATTSDASSHLGRRRRR